MDFDKIVETKIPQCLSCGHGAGSHKKISLEDIGVVMESLLRNLAQQFYPLMQRRDGNGNCKTALEEVDTCIFADCPCADFDLDESQQFFSRRCSCGHRFREHAVTGHWEWIILGLAHVALEMWMNED